MKKILVIAMFSLLSFSPNYSLAYDNLYANDGTFIGNTNTNRFDPNSIHNEFGKYGSQFSPDSVNNQFGKYGSEFSPTSPNNKFSQPGKAVPQYGGFTRNYGGYSNNY